jgi:hypothetical protein
VATLNTFRIREDDNTDAPRSPNLSGPYRLLSTSMEAFEVASLYAKLGHLPTRLAPYEALASSTAVEPPSSENHATRSGVSYAQLLGLKVDDQTRQDLRVKVVLHHLGGLATFDDVDRPDRVGRMLVVERGEAELTIVLPLDGPMFFTFEDANGCASGVVALTSYGVGTLAAWLKAERRTDITLGLVIP